MFRSVALAAVLSVAASAGAHAQNSLSNSLSPGVMAKISASDVVAMMGELGVTTELIAQQGAGPVVLAATPGGGKFVFHLLACDDVASSARCGNVIVTTAFSNAGLAYDDINTFNGEAIVTAAVNVPQEQMVVLGRNIIVLGGHSRELFKTTVYLFVMDVEKFVTKAMSAKTVAFTTAPRPNSKVESITLGGKADASAFGLENLSTEVSTAIANTRGVGFALPSRD